MILIIDEKEVFVFVFKTPFLLNKIKNCYLYFLSFFLVIIYEVQTLLLNGMSVSDTYIGHQHSYDTCRVSNSKSICWISDNYSTVLT